MQHVMDEKGQVLFDNLSWFTKKLCSVMTSVSVCEHMWNIEGWIHNKYRNRLTKPNVENTVRVHDNLVLRKVMMDRNKNVVSSDSQTVITKPDSYTNEQVTDDVDEEDSEDEK